MPEPKQCRPCEISWGLIGLGAALLILAVAVDLISDGALTRLVSPPLAPVIPMPESEADNDSA